MEVLTLTLNDPDATWIKLSYSMYLTGIGALLGVVFVGQISLKSLHKIQIDSEWMSQGVCISMPTDREVTGRQIWKWKSNVYALKLWFFLAQARFPEQVYF